MSRINGDKARFNRERKKKIAQRIRNRKLIKDLSVQDKTAAGTSSAKPKATIA